MEKIDDKEINRVDNDSSARSASKRSFPYFKIAALILPAAVISYLALTIRYKLFFSNEKYYSNYFYYWRINYADKNMMSETYKNIQSNTYSTNDIHMRTYVEMAQGGEVPKDIKDQDERKKKEKELKREGLLNMKFVEHFPRGYMHYHTHTNKIGFSFNEKFLKFRKEIIEKAIKKDPYKDGGSKNNLFVMSDKDLKKTFRPSDVLKKHPEVRSFASALSELLNHLNEGDVYEDVGGKQRLTQRSNDLAKGVVESIKDDIDPGFQLKDEDIYNFVKRNGTISPTIFDTFFYSRSFYVFLLCTLDCDLEKIDIDNDTRPFSVARMYAKLATNMFQTKLDDSKKPHRGFLESKFGKSIDPVYDDKKMQDKMSKVQEHDEENADKLLKHFGKVVENSMA